MTDETKRFLIEQKVSYINATVNVCMLWWASSIVFCGSVLAAVWSQREELQRQPHYVVGLGIVLFVFFFVIAYFGYLLARRLGNVQDEIAALAERLYYVKLKSEKDYFDTEIKTFQISMGLGAGSFALIFIARIVFWFFLLDQLAYISIIWTVIWVFVWAGVEILVWSKRRAKNTIHQSR